MEIHKPRQEAMANHTTWLNARRIYLDSYQGLPVFKINHGMREEENGINFKDYFYTTDIRKGYGITDSFPVSHEALKPENKKGICLHHTGGYLYGDMESLTGNSRAGQTVSVPFLICRTGRIYQLSDPDTDFSSHLGSYLAWGEWHNQIIGIELSNFGHEIPNNAELEQEAFCIPEGFRGATKFERFTDAQYDSLRALIKAICRKYPQIKFELIPQNMWNLDDAGNKASGGTRT